MAYKPFNYPSPCNRCKRNNEKSCTNKSCAEWLAYYYTHQKWINAWAKMHGVPVGKKKPPAPEPEVDQDGQD